MSDLPNSCTAADDHVASPMWLQSGGFIPVLLGISAMFWAISFVCEEFGVPSLAAFCKRNRLSDALTGSIFIGTGLSLPVFFIAVAGLFASNSAIGVGAVVGGNLFNHLFTIGTSIYVCPDRIMKLDPIVFTREMLIYLLTCLLVLWTVANGDLTYAFLHAFEKKQWDSCLSIHWGYSLALVVSYFAYCVIDANFYLIESYVSQCWYGVDFSQLYRIKEAQSELQVTQPAPNPNNENNLADQIIIERLSSVSATTAITAATSFSSNPAAVCLPTPSQNLIVEDVIVTTAVDVEQGFHHHSISSSLNSKVHSSDDLNLALTKVNEENTLEEAKAKSMMDSAFDQGERYIEILLMAKDSNLLQQGFFYMTFPLRYAIYLTIPDVRRPGREHQALLSMSVTVIWLAILSYSLTIALTLIANWWHISSAVMGITIAAWASNFPAHWSSMVVSRHGFGDVSCCNCLGSNTFNNLIGLGLPWLLYSVVYRGNPYDALKDDGVAISVFFMMVTIVVHYLVVWWSNWVLREWMIAPMILMYVGEIAFLSYFYSAMV